MGSATTFKLCSATTFGRRYSRKRSTRRSVRRGLQLGFGFGFGPADDRLNRDVALFEILMRWKADHLQEDRDANRDGSRGIDHVEERRHGAAGRQDVVHDQHPIAGDSGPSANSSVCSFAYVMS
jgi:hypothetical protein